MHMRSFAKNNNRYEPCENFLKILRKQSKIKHVYFTKFICCDKIIINYTNL